MALPWSHLSFLMGLLRSVGVLVGGVLSWGSWDGRVVLSMHSFPQGGLGERLHSMMVSGFQRGGGDSCKAFWVLGSRTWRYYLYHVLFIKASNTVSPLLRCSKIMGPYFFQSLWSTHKLLKFHGQIQLRTDLKPLNIHGPVYDTVPTPDYSGLGVRVL